MANIYALGDKLLTENDIPFRNLITPWQGNASDNNWNTVNVIANIDTTYHDSLGNIGYKIDTAGWTWAALAPIVKVYAGKWYTFTMNAKFLQYSGSVCFYANTGQFGDNTGVVDLNSWKLKINDAQITKLREPNGFEFDDYIEQSKLLNNEFKITLTFKAIQTGNVGLVLESSSTGFQYYGSSYDLRETPWLEEFNDLQNQISRLNK